MDVERIRFERTGGFAGLKIAKELKLADLPDDQARRLQELLDGMDFDELPRQMKGKESMPDQFTYAITVKTKKGEHTVVTGDASAPEKMQELLQLLNRLLSRVRSVQLGSGRLARSTSTLNHQPMASLQQPRSLAGAIRMCWVPCSAPLR